MPDVTYAEMQTAARHHHWTPCHDVADEVGHATVTVADGIGHGTRSAWRSVTSTIGSWF